ncbi:hypothetical protein BVY01_00935 [bacterium I07]|nr:hypothetical protein BVY01_00935 [bacterium I07]
MLDIIALLMLDFAFWGIMNIKRRTKPGYQYHNYRESWKREINTNPIYHAESCQPLKDPNPIRCVLCGQPIGQTDSTMAENPRTGGMAIMHRGCLTKI